MKQGLVNICRNIWFSLASTAIISACIFLFCVFFSVITNIEYMVRTAETTMGITVFFDENLTENEIKDIGAKIESDKSGMIKEIKFVSAEEAWDSFKTEYFGEDEALSEGFADDNPLAGSSSYEIRLNNITDQDGMVAYLESIDGVRKVNYSNSAATGLASFNKILGLLFGVLIGNYKFSGSISIYTTIVSIVLIFYITGLARKMGAGKAYVTFTKVACVVVLAMFTFMMVVDYTQISINPIITVAFVILYALLSASKTTTNSCVLTMYQDSADYEFYLTGKYMPVLVVASINML